VSDELERCGFVASFGILFWHLHCGTQENQYSHSQG